MEQLAFWRNVSIVILGLECLVVLVLLVVLNYVLVRLTGNLHLFARTYARKTQRITHAVADKAEQYAARAVEPLVAADAATVQAREIARSMVRTSAQTPPPAEPKE